MSTNSHRILEYPPIRPPLVIMEKTLKWKPNKIEIAPNCPRCSSSNTKFCYYNNYSVSQPRYFCKSCRRYWTKGGSLRNVPIGGGCRKTRRTRKDFPSPSLQSAEDCTEDDGNNIDVDIYPSCTSSRFTNLEDVEQGNDVLGQGNGFVYQSFDDFEVGGGQMMWSEGFGSENDSLLHSTVMYNDVFGGFDQRMSENLITDSWGSFDLTGYEDF